MACGVPHMHGLKSQSENMGLRLTQSHEESSCVPYICPTQLTLVDRIHSHLIYR